MLAEVEWIMTGLWIVEVVNRLYVLASVVCDALRSVELRVCEVTILSSLVVPAVIRSVERTRLELLVVVSRRYVAIVRSFPGDLDYVSAACMASVSFLCSVVSCGNGTYVAVTRSEVVCMLGANGLVQLRDRSILCHDLGVVSAGLGTAGVATSTLLYLVRLRVERVRFSRGVVTVKKIFLGLNDERSGVSIGLVGRADHLSCGVARI